MLEGTMQNDFQLTVRHVLHRLRGMYGDGAVVTLTDSSKARASYSEVGERVGRLARALESLGVGPGDRVGTFCWNSQQHLELYMAIPCMGAVLHTLNIRLFEEQLTFVVNHAQDKIVIVDDSLVPLLEKVAGQPDEFDYPRIDGDAAASLCYTSGTTGNPRGVLYGHRSTVVHAMAECLTDTLDVRSTDRVLPVVPMFHANAWGLPYA